MEMATESRMIERAREKLTQLLERQEITNDALNRIKEKTRDVLANNQIDRTEVPGKGLALFDNNQNSAPVSQKVKNLMEQILNAQRH